MKKLPDITAACGNTPLVYLDKASRATGADIYGKLEYFNPLSSVKDRIGLAMIDDGVKTGKINPDTVIVEPTSGNTGIALAFVCRVKGLKLILTMPETMSIGTPAASGPLRRETAFDTRGKKGIIQPSRRPKTWLNNWQRLMLTSFPTRPTRNPPHHHGPGNLNGLWMERSISFGGCGHRRHHHRGYQEMIKQKNPHLRSVAVEPETRPCCPPAGTRSPQNSGIAPGLFRPT